MPFKIIRELSVRSINDRFKDAWKQLGYLTSQVGVGGGGSWGGITGTLSDQTDLQTVLDALQTDINTKIDGSGTANQLAYFTDGNTIAALTVATYPSLTELSYVKGVSSAIQTQISAKQATLVSGTNIKTINSTSLLGSGDIAVQDTLVSGTNIKTINSTSLLGSGNIAVQATLVSGTNIKTVNGSTLLGSGDLVVSASPAGSNKQFQYNSSSSFGASSMLTQETNQIQIADGSTSVIPFAILRSQVTNSVASMTVKRSDGVEHFRIDAGGGLQVFGNCTNPIGNAFGGSLEIGYASNIGSITSFDRTGSNWRTLTLAAGGINFQCSGSVKGNFNTSGRLFIGGSTSATAVLHLAAGTATASTAPLKLTAGVNLSTPEDGAFEFDGSSLYFTVGGVRKTVTLV